MVDSETCTLFGYQILFQKDRSLSNKNKYWHPKNNSINNDTIQKQSNLIKYSVFEMIWDIGKLWIQRDRHTS
jgi:hypothetical protein